MQNPSASGFRRCFCTSRPHDMFCFGHASARITFDVLQSAACGLVFVGDGDSLSATTETVIQKLNRDAWKVYLYIQCNFLCKVYGVPISFTLMIFLRGTITEKRPSASSQLDLYASWCNLYRSQFYCLSASRVAGTSSGTANFHFLARNCSLKNNTVFTG